jgi:hypothetical protein
MIGKNLFLTYSLRKDGAVDFGCGAVALKAVAAALKAVAAAAVVHTRLRMMRTI